MMLAAGGGIGRQGGRMHGRMLGGRLLRGAEFSKERVIGRAH